MNIVFDIITAAILLFVSFAISVPLDKFHTWYMVRNTNDENK